MELLVRLDEIKEGGLDLRRELSRDDLASILDAEPPTGFRPTAPSALHVHLDKVNERDVVVRGELAIEADADCRRCLGPAHLHAPVRFTLDFVNREALPARPQPEEDSGEGEIAGTFSPDEADQVVYSGRQLDLGPAVREQILLALPMDALCREECKGLCQICGGNLNEKACACDRHIPDPRWAGLANIKLK